MRGKDCLHTTGARGRRIWEGSHPGGAAAKRVSSGSDVVRGDGSAAASPKRLSSVFCLSCVN